MKDKIALTICIMICLISTAPIVLNIEFSQMMLSVILIIVNVIGLTLTMIPYFFPFVNININLYIASAFFVINIASETSLMFEQKFAQLAIVLSTVSLLFSIVFTIVVNREVVFDKPWDLKNFLRNAFLVSAILGCVFWIDLSLSTSISGAKTVDYIIFALIMTNIIELMDRMPKQKNLLIALVFIFIAFFINFVNVEIIMNRTPMEARIKDHVYRNIYLIFTTFITSGFYFYVRYIIKTAQEQTNLLKTIGAQIGSPKYDKTSIDGYFSVNVQKMIVMEFSSNADLFLKFKSDPDICNLKKKDPYGLIDIIERTVHSGVIESTKLAISDRSYSISSVISNSGSNFTVLFHITDITKQEQEFEEEKRRSRTLEMLVDIANSASKHESIDQLCKYTIQSVTRMLDYEYGAILIIDIITGAVEIHSDSVTTKKKNQFRKLYLNTDDKLVQDVLRSEKEIYADTRLSNASDPISVIMKSLKLNSMVVIPFQVNHEKKGCYIIGSIKNTKVDPSDIQLFRTASTQLGMALDRHLLLETLKQRYKMVENANRTKDELITMIGHELKTPLTSIVGYTELLDIDNNNLTKKQREFVSTLHHQSDILSWLVSGINLLTMLKTRKYSLEKEEVEIGKILQRLQGRFTRQENRNEIKIINNIDEKTIIKTDVTAFLGICTNLLTAFERLSNLESQIDFSISKSDDTVSIEISDNSNPIGNDDLGKIYEVFSTLSTKPSTINRGTIGLPLSIVKEFTDLLGGNLWFHSLPSGNKVVVILPGVFPNQ